MYTLEQQIISNDPKGTTGVGTIKETKIVLTVQHGVLTKNVKQLFIAEIDAVFDKWGSYISYGKNLD